MPEDGPLQIYPHTLHLHVMYGRSTAIKSINCRKGVHVTQTHDAAMHFVFIKMNDRRSHAYFLYANRTEQRLKDDRRNTAHLQTKHYASRQLKKASNYDTVAAVIRTYNDCKALWWLHYHQVAQKIKCELYSYLHPFIGLAPHFSDVFPRSNTYTQRQNTHLLTQYKLSNYS